jgi:hypothetical protein
VCQRAGEGEEEEQTDTIRPAEIVGKSIVWGETISFVFYVVVGHFWEPQTINIESSMHAWPSLSQASINFCAVGRASHRKMHSPDEVKLLKKMTEANLVSERTAAAHNQGEAHGHNRGDAHNQGEAHGYNRGDAHNQGETHHSGPVFLPLNIHGQVVLQATAAVIPLWHG